jgi:hypothetical protein
VPASRGGSGGEAAGRSRARAGGVCGLRRLWERCVRKGERPRAAPPDAGVLARRRFELGTDTDSIESTAAEEIDVSFASKTLGQGSGASVVQ